MPSPKRLPLVERLKTKLKSNPNVNLVDMNIPLGNGTEIPRLKDILEENVDEKYYLKHSIVQKIVEEVSFRERLVSIKLDKEGNNIYKEEK